ncbi:MAG: tRNA (N(6)-L-threonylcarbamoyladenosine(37)-C(2))-methylthiotransferase MtaB [Holosporales bacterium]|jgi:threonylcarbamoyladenosine tRNA methylthiotransferase MtaB|nr:tRNA (N(6)-L-threonylcarbamoyladenosine(37)-C(2))-methylthiotransferase MtaB [Holosporales bacterium]
MSTNEKDHRKVITFGCRLNTYESERIKQKLKDIDDIIVVNTCAVTAEAERQARQAIRKLHKENPEKKIIVTGCSATLNKSVYEKMPQVYAVIANQEKNHIQSALNNLNNSHNLNNTSPADFLPVLNADTTANATITPTEQVLYGFEGRSRAFLQIQTGCDNCCSFCVIRKARGPSKSFPVLQILKQAGTFVHQGYREINLTGVNITSFNSDGYTLGSLIQLLLSAFPQSIRFRLSSLDPADIDDSLLGALRNHRLLPHLHLSLQSGDNSVLKKMLRRHTSETAAQAIALSRAIRPDIVFGCDIICGFPTETEEMFENTCNFVEKNGIPLLHVFPYSDRPGTVAQSLSPKVPKAVKKDRARRLRAIGQSILAQTMNAFVGTEVPMLIEKEANGEFSGKTDHFLPIVARCADEAKVGDVVSVVIKRVDNLTLYNFD